MEAYFRSDILVPLPWKLRIQNPPGASPWGGTQVPKPDALKSQKLFDCKVFSSLETGQLFLPACASAA